MTVQTTKDLERDKIKKEVEKTIPQAPADKKQLMEETLYKIIVEKKSPMEAMGFTQDQVEVIYLEAYNNFQGGKYKEAIDYFSMLRTIDPTSYRFAFALAAAHHYKKDYMVAAGYYILCSKIDFKNPVPRFHLYDCFMKTDQPLAAYEALSGAILLAKLDPAYKTLQDKAEMEEKYLIGILETYDLKTKKSALSAEIKGE